MNQALNRLLQENKTAFYVFDIGKLKARIAHLQAALPPEVVLCYAVKANTFITKELIDTIHRFEICSPGEAEICRAVGVPSENMVISGVYKTPEVMEAMVADPSFHPIYTVESLEQYELFRRLAKTYGRTLPLLLRLTNGSQFGINKGDIEAIVARRGETPEVDILGIQFFSGTQKTSLKKLKREVGKLDDLLTLLEEKYGFAAQELEYGPGFPVSYFQSDELDEAELLSGFSELLHGMTHHPKVTLELGRSIAASCGTYYTHIVDLKRNQEQNYALVDGGMHHLVYFGQHMAMKQPFFHVCGKEALPATDQWNICGSLCSMNDVMTKQSPLPDLALGDVLAFENAGAYCMTEGISLFLSRDIPAVYLLLENGTAVQVRKAFDTATLNQPNYGKDV